MNDIKGKGTGIIIGGHNFNNLRYADDAVVINEQESGLQHMITAINDTCKLVKTMARK